MLPYFWTYFEFELYTLRFWFGSSSSFTMHECYAGWLP